MNCLEVMDKSEFEYCGGCRELHDFGNATYQTVAATQSYDYHLKLSVV
jgi:hypothetical protein